MASDKFKMFRSGYRNVPQRVGIHDTWNENEMSDHSDSSINLPVTCMIFAATVALPNKCEACELKPMQLILLASHFRGKIIIIIRRSKRFLPSMLLSLNQD